jgi:putative peptide zinc metalloprotease protein
MPPMTERLPESGRYVLRDDVEIIRRSSSLLLFGRRDERTVRASPAAALLLPLLREGADFESLRASLQAAQPAAVDIRSKLAGFLGALVQSGLLLDGSAEPGAAGPRRTKHMYPLFSPDRPAAAAASVFALLGRRGGVAAAILAALAALAAIAALAGAGGLPRLPDQVQALHWGGVLLFFLVVAPVHEFAHAVACRLAGENVGKAGILMHGGLVPGPYVDTSQSYRIPGRWQRFMIPAAGPFTNLLAAGAVAAALLFGGWDSEVTAVLQGLLLFCLLFLFFDTNPFTASDGSHCIEALLDDELARRHALRPAVATVTDPAVVKRYRAAMVAWAAIGALLFAWWWA